MNASGNWFIADTVSLAFDSTKIGLAMTMRADAGTLYPEEAIRLLCAVAKGRDRAAFAALFGFYAPRLKAFMMRSGMTASAAEDVAQETMLLVWKKASYFDERRAGVSTWIFTIARNVRIDRLRRESRPAAVARAFDPSDEVDGPVSGEAAVMTAEREDRVRSAIALLSSEQAQILRLSFFGDKPQSEIASELGIPLGTVKSRVRLALGRLRLILDDLK
ncbi:sigma-70 family RNA polymerase sigma factor [Mesorhizobium sp. Mes31]|uniref:sigma-70 family RNA polymerase sigma factor n=1 Tax=Mesorhizobium sp. Mes31 TaxID=2926017 RepID=UPI002741108E|nr:sigma-70 family RNA polymerase sigma factor [Mesorhizobium sp. Mes31]